MPVEEGDQRVADILNVVVKNDVKHPESVWGCDEQIELVVNKSLSNIKKEPTILVIADTQCKSEEDLDYMLWVGKYIAYKKPDIIVHIGDHYDFPSLSSYDKGKSSSEGRRLNNDIEAGNRGFEYYVNKNTDTQLLVKPEARGSRVYGRDYLLPDGTVGKYSDEQLDQLYAEGGYIASLRKPEDFNGETISHVIVRNNATEGYARRIRDDDVTLGYRDGYYHVKYTDPYYITAKSKDGTVKTIARAETRSDMEAELTRLRSMNDGVVS